MSHEAQIQSKLSWAIPRYLEEKEMTWAGYVTPSSAQSTGRPNSMGFDFLVMLNAKAAIALELKYNKNSAITKTEELDFNPGQLEALRNLNRSIPSYILYNQDDDVLWRAAVPSAIEAKKVLHDIKAVSPDSTELHATGAIDTSHGLLDKIINQSQQDSESSSASSEENLESWQRIGKDICTCFANGVLPRNLYFFFVEKNGLTSYSSSTLQLVFDFLNSKQYGKIAKEVNAFFSKIKEISDRFPGDQKMKTIHDGIILKLNSMIKWYASTPDANDNSQSAPVVADVKRTLEQSMAVLEQAFPVPQKDTAKKGTGPGKSW